MRAPTRASGMAKMAVATWRRLSEHFRMVDTIRAGVIKLLTKIHPGGRMTTRHSRLQKSGWGKPVPRMVWGEKELAENWRSGRTTRRRVDLRQDKPSDGAIARHTEPKSP
jgi:hypothetical protein